MRNEMDQKKMQLSLGVLSSLTNPRKLERKIEEEKSAVLSSEDDIVIIVKHSMPSSDNGTKRKSFTKRQTVAGVKDIQHAVHV